MRNLVLVIVMVGLLAIGNAVLAFDVSVSMTDETGNENGMYQTVEMQPVNEQGTASAEAGATESEKAVVAEKK